jgi:hypothetical protein
MSSISDEEHLVRFVPYSKTIRSDDDETIIGIAPQAFELRPGKDIYLSVSCREKADSAIPRALKKLTRWYGTLFTTKRAALTCGRLSDIRKTCDPTTLTATHSEKSWNFAYTELWHLPDNDLAVLQKLATETWADFSACKDVK